MLKYAVAVTKGDKDTILALFDPKKEARAYGKAHEPVDGLLCMFSSDFDESGKQTTESIRLYECFNR